LVGDDAFLSAATVGEYLVGRGLVRPGDRVEARELGGGVSNVVLAVQADGLSCVVKQALPRLRVATEWLAKRERAITEGKALALAARLTPGAVPDVLDLDEEACAVALALAPPHWLTWKEMLMLGEADEAAASRVGEILATWHRETAGDERVARELGDREAFEQLRIDPYHRTVARRHPDLHGPIAERIEALVSSPRCLVHGDYSPKNVLLGDEGLWIVDFEVAHVGNPVFDLAFMLNHLMLKAVHRPETSEGYERCAETFWNAYRRDVPGALLPEPEELLSHVGCLMLARADGKSPAEYLTEEERRAARAAGRTLLLDPPGNIAAAWDVLIRAGR
jgi:5-methylthioribose kinase